MAVSVNSLCLLHTHADTTRLCLSAFHSINAVRRVSQVGLISSSFLYILLLGCCQLLSCLSSLIVSGAGSEGPPSENLRHSLCIVQYSHAIIPKLVSSLEVPNARRKRASGSRSRRLQHELT